MAALDDRSIHYYIAYSLASSFTCLTVILNVLILGLICFFRWNRTPRNIFIAAISLADIVLATSFTVLNLEWDFESNWRLGGAACVMKEFVIQASCTARAYHLAILIFERYLSMHSSWPHINNLAAIFTILIISLVSCLDCIPWTYFFDYSDQDDMCLFIANYTSNISLYNMHYRMVIATCTVACFIPVLYLMIMSVIISIGNDSRMKHLLKQDFQLKDISVVLWMIIVFTISWTPIYIHRMICYFLDFYDFQGKPHVVASYLFTAFTLLQVSIGITFPLIYLSNDIGFRHSLRQICCCFKSAKWKPDMTNEYYDYDASYIDNRSNEDQETTKLTSFSS